MPSLTPTKRSQLSLTDSEFYISRLLFKSRSVDSEPVGAAGRAKVRNLPPRVVVLSAAGRPPLRVEHGLTKLKCVRFETPAPSFSRLWNGQFLGSSGGSLEVLEMVDKSSFLFNCCIVYTLTLLGLAVSLPTKPTEVT